MGCPAPDTPYTDETSGLVHRAVTQVATPGTVVDELLLEAGTSTNWAATVGAGDADVATCGTDADVAADADDHGPALQPGWVSAD